MAYLIVLLVIAIAVYAISAPLRARREGGSGGLGAGIGSGAPGGSDAPGGAGAPGRSGGPAASVAELEAARDAKYLEIRDAELDQRTGKLSDADYEAIDQSLRAEAIAILHALDRAHAGAAAARGAQ